MSSGDFMDDAVGAQEAQTVTDPGGAAANFLAGGSGRGEEVRLQVTVAELVQGKFASAYGLEPNEFRDRSFSSNGKNHLE
jgi:hypothetical protein